MSTERPTNPSGESVDDLRDEILGNWMLVPLDVANHLTAPVVDPAKVVDALVAAARTEGERDGLLLAQAITMNVKQYAWKGPTTCSEIIRRIEEELARLGSSSPTSDPQESERDSSG